MTERSQYPINEKRVQQKELTIGFQDRGIMLFDSVERFFVNHIELELSKTTTGLLIPIRNYTIKSEKSKKKWTL